MGEWEPSRTREQNVRTAITLFLREAEGAGREKLFEIRQDTHDIIDYVRNASRRNESVGAKTWGGLRKASERWHREQAAFWADVRRANRKGGILAWNSLLGENEALGFQLIPLTDEWQLLEESEEMDHCVADYGPGCASGHSRIFSIRQDGKRVAATQIANWGSGSWRVQQTRGRNNGPVGGKVGQAALSAASAYTKLWKQEGAEHRSWTGGKPGPEQHGPEQHGPEQHGAEGPGENE